MGSVLVIEMGFVVRFWHSVEWWCFGSINMSQGPGLKRASWKALSREKRESPFELADCVCATSPNRVSGSGIQRKRNSVEI